MEILSTWWQQQQQKLPSEMVLSPALFWPTVRKNCSSDREKKTFEIIGGKQRIWKKIYVSLNRTIYLNSKRSVQLSDPKEVRKKLCSSSMMSLVGLVVPSFLVLSRHVSDSCVDLAREKSLVLLKIIWYKSCLEMFFKKII